MSDQQWDYLVIHVNFEPGTKDEKKSNNLEIATEKLQGSLSSDFLQKEFPNQFKPQATPLHPSKQLENFLRRCGNEGWKLVETVPLGGLLMFIFMKPKNEIIEEEKVEKNEV